MRLVEFTVRGVPAPQGSVRAYAVAGRPYVHSLTPALTAWRYAVADEARRAMGGDALMDGPLHVYARFSMPRPASRPRRVKYPSFKPDIDKLVRAVFDALTGVVYHDDAQVVVLHAEELYAEDVVGVQVVVKQLEGD